jgi:hypothetical protein
MKKVPVLALGTLATLISASFASAAAVTTVGVYDEATQTNFVDFYVTTQTTTPTATTGATDPLDGYKSAFGTGFASNFGGVVNFDAADIGSTNSIEATYGVGSSKILNIGVSGGFRAVAFGSSSEISGGREAIFTTSGGADTGQGTFTFGSIIGGLANEAVVQFGLTFLGRVNGEVTVAGRATYSDGTTGVLLSRSIPIGNAHDTFFGFTAPTGLAITSVTFDQPGATGSSAKTFDDVAFVTAVVPEPTSLGLLGVAGVALASRRRRQS